MSKKRGPDSLRISVPAETGDWYRQQAAREGIPLQSIIAPLLNAVARGQDPPVFYPLPGDKALG